MTTESVWQRIAGLSSNKRALLELQLQQSSSASSASEAGKELVAYVVPSSPQAPLERELRAFLRAKLPEYMVPSAIVVLPELPLTPSGKVDRRALLAPGLVLAEAPASGSAPMGSTEQRLVELWRELLQRERVERDDDFFALGGHSLLAAQAVSRIRRDFDLELPLRELFEASTPRLLASRIDALRGSPTEAVPAPIPLASREGPLPLSFAQERLWVFSELEPLSAVYNMPGGVRLVGRLEVSALERGLAEIVRRHEVLRTTFGSVDGRPVQRIHPAGPFPLPLVDLRSTPAGEQQALLSRVAEEEGRRPFDLGAGPLIRGRLLRLTDEEHQLILSMHHIVSDGWSLGVLLRELAALYGAFVRGLPSDLPELPLQYADHAAWQRRELEGPALRERLAYWRERLQDAPRFVELPTDRPRPAVQTYRGAIRTISLPRPLTQALEALGQAQGATSFMTLLAAFQIFLARASGQDDIVVGSPVVHRDRVELEGLIGCFLNTLVLRTRLDGEPSFREALTRVRAVTLEAFSHQDVPFEKLVEVLQPERDPSRAPLFQVGFVVQNAEATQAPVAVPGLTLSPFEFETGTVKYDLTLSLEDTARGMTAAFQYNVDLFDEDTIARMQRHFQTLLESIVRAPDLPIGELEWLPAEERQRLLVEWNATRTALPEDATLQGLFEAQVARTPDAIAVVFEGKRLTYRELDRRAERLALVLEEQGVGPDVRVLLCMERSLELVVGMLGVLKAGGAYVPLDPSYPQERLAFMAEDSRAPVLLGQRAFAERLPRTGARTVLVDALEELSASSLSPRTSRVRSEHLAYVLYTSGSTGKPKAVMISHRAIVNHMLWMGAQFPLERSDRVLQKTPFSFDASIWEFHAPLLSGARLVLARPGAHRDTTQLIETIIEQEITILQVVPTLLQVLLDEPAFEACTSLRRVFCGGEALTTALAARFHERLPDTWLCNLYGPTETTVESLAWTYRPEDPGLAVPIGRPIWNMRAHVLDRRLQPVPVGVPGELYLGGVGLARGYLERPDLTAERFVPDPFSTEGERLYRTGDLARQLRDGAFVYLGRVDQQVKLRGFRLELGEVEAVLAAHPALREVAVVVRGEGNAPQLVGYVAPHAPEGSPPRASEELLAELRTFLQARLPEYMVPSAFVVLDALPRMPSGKIDRQALPAPKDVGLQTRRSFVAPRGPVEETLAGIWEQVLGSGPVGAHDNFFELGGDSILAIQVVSAARRKGLELTPKKLFEQPTLSGLASGVGQVAEVKTDQGPVVGSAPLTPIQRAFFELELVRPEHWNQSLLLEVEPSVEAPLLEAALRAVVRHHDALRLRFTRGPSGWQQHFAVSEEPVVLERIVLSGVAEKLRQKALEAAATRLHQTLDLAHGPLLRAAWMDLGEAQAPRLLLVAHHLVVDGVSWRILVEDLVAACLQLRAGGVIQLPLKTTSYQAWVERLLTVARSSELAQERAYWRAQPWARAAALPVDMPGGENTEAGVRTVQVELTHEETQALVSRVPEVYRTRLEDVLLTALAEALGRWTGQERVLVELEGHGRQPLFEDVDVSRTVGWFTSVYPVLLSWRRDRGPGQSLKAIKEQLRQVPQRGLGYGLLRYLRDEGTEGTSSWPEPEVSFNYLGQLDAGESSATLLRLAPGPSGRMRDPQARRRYLLEVDGHIARGQLQVSWSHGAHVHRTETIEAVARDFLAALKALLAHCLSPEAGGTTPSDFPLARPSQEWLDRLEGGGRFVEDLYPLSPLQQGFLFYGLSVSETKVGVERTSYTVQGTLDFAAFEKAWRRVLERHAVLRTWFASEGLPRPVQLVNRHVYLPLDMQDWRTLSPIEQRQRLHSYHEASEELDVSRPPLMRLGVIRLEDELFQIVWTHHHLLLDGWSVPRVLREVVAYHDAFRRGEELALEQPRPYRDYIEWLLRQAPGDSERYWREVLRGFQAPTPLVLDMGGGSAEGHPGEQHHEQVLKLSVENTSRVMAFVRRQRMTLNTLVQAAWALLLSRYSGEEDIVFGTTVSGRPAELPGVESMVGMFINVVPTRIQVTSGVPVGTWLERLQHQQREQQPFEYTPSFRIQEWSEVPLGLPLFDSLLVFENYPERAAPLAGASGRTEAGLVVRGIDASVRTRYRLTLVTLPDAELTLYVAYERRHFSDAALTRLLGHLETLVLGLASATSEQTLEALPLLTSEEQRQLQEWGQRTQPPVRVVDVSHRPVPVGIPGEVYRLESQGEGEAWRPTGRLARYLPDGTLEPLGRIEDVFPWRGHRVIPAWIQAVLNLHAAVRESAVTQRVNAEGRPELVVHGVPRTSVPPSLGALRGFLKERLSSAFLPAHVFIVPELPHRDDGSVDLARLTASTEPEPRAEDSGTPRTPTEQRLARLWSELFGLAHVGTSDDFFDLGGQSVAVIQLLSRLRDTLGVELPVRSIFEARTLGAIAREVDRVRAETESAPSAERLAAREARRSPFEREPLKRLPPAPHYDLSPYQYPEYYFSQLAPDSPMYNILSCEVLFTGECDLEAMRRAWETVVNRHGVFRTTFTFAEGKPVQRIGPAWKVKLEDIYLDYTWVPEERWLEESAKLAHQYGDTTLDFTHGPMFHLKLAQFPGQRFLLIFLTNHVLWDEVSSINMSAELRAAYDAYRAGREPVLPELPLDYVDYTQWVNQGVRSGLFERERQYWLRRFADNPEPLELPTDFPRPPQQTFNGSDVEGAVPRETTARLLNVFLKEHSGATLSMFLHAVFNLLLYRLSGQRDIVLGMPIANRGDAKLEHLMGPFATGMPMRCVLEDRMTFAELLGHTQQVTLEALDHYAYPSIIAIQEINPKWDMSRGRLFNVMYGLQHNKTKFWADMQLDGVRAHRMAHLANIGPMHNTSRCDLRLIAEELGPDILFSLAYNSDLYKRSTIQRMAEQYLSLIAQVMEEPHKPLSQYLLTTEAERHALLSGFNATHAPFRLEGSVHARFEAQVVRTPDAPAVFFEDRSLSYQQLEKAANQWAHELLAQGVQPEEKVGVLFEPSPEMVVAVLAVLKAGAAYVPLMPDQPEARLQLILREAGARVLLVGEGTPVVAGFEGRVLRVDAAGGAVASRPHQAPAVRVHERQLAVVFCTSGTTGQPKGIEIEHRGITNVLEATQQAYGLKPHEATLFYTPYNFDASLLDLFWPLFVGGRIVLPRADQAKNPEALARLVDRHGVAVIQCVPLMLGALIDAREEGRVSALSSLRVVICGSALLTRDLRDRFARVFSRGLFNHYGPTETTVDASRFDTAQPFDGEGVPIGRPVSNTRISVLDKHLTVQPYGVPGEIYISGPGVARGYLEDPAKTAERFLPDPHAEQPGARMYRTGDLGRITEEGWLYFTGRVDRQVKVRGNRVELDEIETRLASHPALQRCAIRHRRGEAGNDTLEAYVELRGRVNTLTGGQAPVRFYTLAQRPELKPKMDALHASAWPEYFAGDAVQREYWPRLATEFAAFQGVLVDAHDEVIGVGNALPIRWNGTLEDLPEGWDEGLRRGCLGREKGEPADTLMILAGVVSEAAEGQGYSAVILKAFKGLARALKLPRVLAPVRPTGKTAHPELSFEAWCARRRADGQLEDPWLRVHERLGGRVLRIAPRSQHVRAELALWERWTGQRFSQSGPYSPRDMLQPILVDVEQGVAEYFDPSVWVEHPDNDATPTLESVEGRDLQAFLREVLPEYMVPEHFHFLPAMPLTASGKIDLQALPRYALTRVRPARQLVPRTPEQEKLLAIWKDVLKTEDVGITDNFFELGGHSIRAVQMLARTAEVFGVNVPLRRFFQEPVIQGLERALSELSHGAHP